MMSCVRHTSATFRQHHLLHDRQDLVVAELAPLRFRVNGGLTRHPRPLLAILRMANQGEQVNSPITVGSPT